MKVALVASGTSGSNPLFSRRESANSRSLTKAHATLWQADAGLYMPVGTGLDLVLDIGARRNPDRGGWQRFRWDTIHFGRRQQEAMVVGG